MLEGNSGAQHMGKAEANPHHVPWHCVDCKRIFTRRGTLSPSLADLPAKNVGSASTPALNMADGPVFGP